MYYNNEIYHHGVKGQKWGVRRYQYADGSLTPSGRKRYQDFDSGRNQNTTTSVIKKTTSIASMKVSEFTNSVKTQITGRQYVDTYLKQGTTFSRIQSSSEFENFAFYATYKKADMDKYMGLFGSNIVNRANGEARRAEAAAKKSGSEEDMANAKALREKANNTKVYQLKIEATKKLKVPSDDNAADITVNLLKEKDFRENVTASIDHAKEIMKRPTQQILFTQAQNAMKKDLTRLSSSEKVAIYKALNLSLVNHNAQEVAAQDRFYTELKKKGYDALLDYNDKDYSSYHAKRPMIVFNTEAVQLKSVAETNPKIVAKLNVKYNAERMMKELPANTLGYISKMGSKTVSECSSYTRRKVEDYLAG